MRQPFVSGQARELVGHDLDLPRIAAMVCERDCEIERMGAAQGMTEIGGVRQGVLHRLLGLPGLAASPMGQRRHTVGAAGRIVAAEADGLREMALRIVNREAGSDLVEAGFEIAAVEIARPQSVVDLEP